MKQYLFWFGFFALITAMVHYGILFTIRSPIPAQYGTREIIEVKRHISDSLSSPKIIILGGSNVLFGFDAITMEKELGIPTVNYGLHAAMRLDDLLGEARRSAKSGDIVVLPLEADYYAVSRNWTDWQLENAIAWNSGPLDHFSFLKQLEIYLQGSSPQLSFNLVRDALLFRLKPGGYQERLFARGPAGPIVQRWTAIPTHDGPFSYSYENLDARGDMSNAVSDHVIYWGPSTPLTEPGRLSDYSHAELAAFLAEMKARNVHVYFAHSPYIVDGPVTDPWQEAEAEFEKELGSMGGELIDRRDQLFFPRSYFFDTRYHLNTVGRTVHTRILIEALRATCPRKN